MKTEKASNIRILFVCLGNICRSPMAEEIFRQKTKEKGVEKKFDIDSAGIGNYHTGDLPDPRMRVFASKRGYELTHHARQIQTEDFERFDLIVGMDDSNIDDLEYLAPGFEEKQKIHRMAEYFQYINTDHVPDPYYGGTMGFHHVIDLLENGCDGLLKQLTNNN